MASYPSAVYAPRTKENKTGIVYDPTQKTIGYAEDIVKLDNEVVALETELGLLPKATSASVQERLKGIRSLSDAAADVLVVKGSNVGIGTTGPTDNFVVRNTEGHYMAQQLLLTNSSGITGFTNGAGALTRVAYTGGAGSPTIGGFKINATDLAAGSEDADFEIALAYNGTVGNKLMIKNDGNVGIGTTNPLQALHIGTSSGTAVARYLSVTNISGATTGAIFGQDNANNTLVYNQQNGYMAFATNNTEWMRIKSDGNVGIGTTIPTAKLDINSDIIRLRTAKTPASAGAAGNAGDICWDANFIYICVATNSWTRVAIAAW